MKAELKSLHSPDVEYLEDYHPSGDFAILVQALIGPKGTESVESFDFLVCTPGWLGNQLVASDYRFGRHYLFMRKYDYSLLKKAIEDLCNRFFEPDWVSLAEKLSRYGRSEFEDYRPS